MQGGIYQVTVTAANNSGEDQGILTLSFVDKSGFSHFVEFNCSGYTGSTTLKDFPFLLRLDSSVSNFSLKSFSSPNCYDLRIYDQLGRELQYEIDEIDHSTNSLTTWVKTIDLNSSTVITAYWGNSLLAASPPEYTGDGSTWDNGFRAVWHLRALDKIDVLTDSSVFRNHAEDEFGYGDGAVIGAGRFLSGGVEKFLRVPSSYSIDDLHEESFTFSSWIQIQEEPPTEAENAVYASGYLIQPTDPYFDNIESFKNLTPSGSRIMKSGPRQGLYLDGDNDFKNSDIGINRNDNYMTLFLAKFSPQEDGGYQFKCERKDDYATIWLDLDQDGVFERNGVMAMKNLAETTILFLGLFH